MKFHKHHPQERKTFGQRIAHAGRHIGRFLDKGIHVAHQAVSHIDPGLVDAVAGPEYGAVLRHAKQGLAAYETGRAVVTGARR